MELKNYFETCGKNATDRSKTTQNDIICVLSDMVLGSPVKDIRATKFFTVICDEVQDASSVEQLSFIVRYASVVGGSKCSVKEVFLGFKELHRDMTGQAVTYNPSEAC